ncbi:MAG: DJ-1/PfpI family protein [Herbaspirillum sp.]|nr:DJ-1/PfpI family protein [Herbaspirillum sp.]
MKTVTMVVFEGVQALDISGPLDVFSEANRFLLPQDRYVLQTVSVDNAAVTCSNAMSVNASTVWHQAGTAFDMLLVAGGPGLPQRQFDPALYAWLRQACMGARKFGAICNGAFMLGRAGLLDGRTVTTHWSDADALAAICQHTRVEADRIYVQDERLYTSAGVTAGIDLALYLLRQDWGADVALNVAKRLVVVMQRTGGQSQFSPYLSAFAPPESVIAEVQRYVLSHLREGLAVAQLAQVAKMSVRGFARAFVRATGVAPAEFVQRARIDAARVLLEQSVSPIKTIAYECGFGDAGRMRNAFVRSLGLSPQRYRECFGQGDTA